jgi:hypothetical protein
VASSRGRFNLPEVGHILQARCVRVLAPKDQQITRRRSVYIFKIMTLIFKNPSGLLAPCSLRPPHLFPPDASNVSNCLLLLLYLGLFNKTATQ